MLTFTRPTQRAAAGRAADVFGSLARSRTCVLSAGGCALRSCRSGPVSFPRAACASGAAHRHCASPLRRPDVSLGSENGMELRSAARQLPAGDVQDGESPTEGRHGAARIAKVTTLRPGDDGTHLRHGLAGRITAAALRRASRHAADASPSH